MERPSEEEVQATAEKTKAALEKLVNGKIKAAQPKNVPDAHGNTSFIRYTPGQQAGSAGLKQRIIKMTEVVEDPLEPPRFKHKKIPRGPPSPPPPLPPQTLTQPTQPTPPSTSSPTPPSPPSNPPSPQPHPTSNAPGSHTTAGLPQPHATRRKSRSFSISR